jgi:MSHA biogenesis protein MshJ
MLKNVKLWMVKFDELPVRERVIALVGALALLLFAFDFILITPRERQRKTVTQRVEAQRLERDKISSELAGVARQLAQIAPVKESTALEDLKQQIAMTEAQIEQMVSKTPETEALVKRALDSSKGLTLLSLKTAAVTRFAGVEPAAASAGAKPAPNHPLTMSAVYRHPVDVGIQGNYLAVLAYLEILQGNSTRLFWGDLRMTTMDYPNSVFNLTVFTLAAQPALIR